MATHAIKVGLLALVLLAACNPVKVPTPAPIKVVDPTCSWVRAITVSKLHDVMTDETAKEIDAHNKAVLQHCGPDAPRGLAKPPVQ